MKRAGIAFALCCFLIISINVAYAADFSNGIINKEKVIGYCAEVTAEKYPNSDDVLVDDFIRVEYEADGTSLEWDDTYNKVLTEKGKESNQSLTFNFTMPYSTIEIKLLEIIKPDGSVVEIDIASQIKEMVDPSQMQSNIYNPNAKVINLGVPGLEVGDTIHYVSFRKTVKARMANTWADWQVFENTSPIKHLVYEVWEAKDKPIAKKALLDEVKGSVTHSLRSQESKNVHRWEIRDIPRIYLEPDMPAYHTCVQRLLLSTVNSWEDISKWYWDISEPHLKSTPEMEAKVAEITKDITDDQAKIEAIFKFVSQEIRYLGITIEKDAPGYEPHDVKLTFDNRHGVCRDKAALLVAMLRIANFEAFPVLIYSGPKKDPEVPNPFFNHAVSAVRKKDGSYILMDSTDESTKRLFPSYLNNCSYIVATPEGDTLRVSDIIPSNENMMDISTTGTLSSRGKLNAVTELKFNGINDNAYRGYFARIDANQRKQFFETVFKKVVPGAVVTSLEVLPENMMDTATGLSAKVVFEAEDVLISNGQVNMFAEPRIGGNIGLVNFIIGKTGLKERRFPMKTDYACGVNETLSLELEGDFGKAVSLAGFDNIETNTLKWNRELKVEDNKLSSNAKFTIGVVEFTPEQYLELKESLKKIELNNRKKNIFAKDSEDSSPDAIVLSDETVYDIESDSTWTVTNTIKKKILSYKGKKDNSELKFSFNPAWLNVELIYARVINGDSVKEISEEEKNLMDDAWVASAPRYPAAKTLVASLPGVEAGSIIEYQYKLKYVDRPFFFATETFQAFDPIESKTVTVNQPEGFELNIITDDNGMNVKDDGIKIISVDDNKSWSAKDRKALKRETSSPSVSTFSPYVRFSSGEWKKYATKVNDALLSAAVANEKITAKANELATGNNDIEQQVILIRDYIAKNIRGAGPGLASLPMSAITNADITLSDGYGNTTDRAILTYTMLKALGIESEFVLASSIMPLEDIESIAKKYPQQNHFNNVLVRVKLSDKTVYLNDTDQYAKLGTTAFDGQLGLETATGNFVKIEAGIDKKNQSEFDIIVTVNDDSSAKMVITQKYYGSSYAALKRYYDQVRPEEKRRHFQEIVAGFSQAANATGEFVTDFASYPGVRSFEIEVKDFAVVDGDYYYLNLPVIFSSGLALRGTERTIPWMSNIDITNIAKLTVVMPKSYTKAVLVPQDKQINLPDGLAKINISSLIHGNTIVMEYKSDYDPAIVDSNEYKYLLEADKEISHPQSWTVLLSK